LEFIPYPKRFFISIVSVHYVVV